MQKLAFLLNFLKNNPKNFSKKFYMKNGMYKNLQIKKNKKLLLNLAKFLLKLKSYQFFTNVQN